MQNQKFIINTEMFCDKVSNQKFTQDEGDLFDEYFDRQSDHDDVQNAKPLGGNLDHVLHPTESQLRKILEEQVRSQ